MVACGKCGFRTEHGMCMAMIVLDCPVPLDPMSKLSMAHAGEGTSDQQSDAADRWAHLPRRGAPARPLQIRRQNSLTTQPSYGSVRGHDLATRMFAPGVRN